MDLPYATLGDLRESGHLCFPYESEDERRRTLATFIREGLSRRERCLYIGVPADQREMSAELEQAGISVDAELERGALVLATQVEIYHRSGRFDPEDALAVMEGLTDRALAAGFAGLRATGEAAAPVSDEVWPLVTRYEALLNERLGRRPFLALCRFPATRYHPDRVQDVLRTHPHVLVRGDVCSNPFYERPEVVLSNDSRARLDWQLHQLRAYNRARRRTEAGAVDESARAREARARDRVLAVLTDELADPLFALKREVHALGAALDEAPALDRIEAAQRHLRRLSAVVDEARDLARLVDREARPPLASRSAGVEGDLGAIVRAAADPHGDALAVAGATLVVDAPAPIAGAWDREAVQRLVSTFLRGAAARGTGRAVTIAVRAHDGGATLSFREGSAGVSDDEARASGAGYTVELPLADRRPRG